MASTLWPTRTRIYFLDVTVVTVIQIVALDVKACLQYWKSPQVTTIFMAITCTSFYFTSALTLELLSC